METVSDLNRWRELRSGPAFRGLSVGFVPTMGALHAGHRSLLERCSRENGVSVASIFVNPTQFDNPGDLGRYPRTWDSDAGTCEDCSVDYLLAPDYAGLYPDGYAYRVSESRLSPMLCGACRPGHFEGMLTVVLKLLNLVLPDRAYFGEKDYQQLELVRGMAEAFFLKTEIVACPTVREPDGLAMSSRNRLLSPAEREKAAVFARLLSSPLDRGAVLDGLKEAGFEVDYVEDRLGRRFGAVRLGPVRLIDNVRL